MALVTFDELMEEAEPIRWEIVEHARIRTGLQGGCMIGITGQQAMVAATALASAAGSLASLARNIAEETFKASDSPNALREATSLVEAAVQSGFGKVTVTVFGIEPGEEVPP
jgi:hypothetical protein